MKKCDKISFKGLLSGKHFRPKGGLNIVVDLGILQKNLFFKSLDKLRFLPGGLVVTNAGVAFMVDACDAGALDISNYNSHDSGIGITAAAVGDTDIQTVGGSVTRATGTKSQPADN